MSLSRQISPRPHHRRLHGSSRPIENLTLARHVDALSRPDVVARASVQTTFALIQHVVGASVNEHQRS